MDEDLCFTAIGDISQRLKAKSLSPVELTQAYLRRARDHNPQLHAYIRLFDEPALQAARAAESEIAAGHWRGPLHGIPVALKDNFASTEGPTSCHSALLEQHHPREDAHVVTLLRRAGAIILGKTSMWEFATTSDTSGPRWPAARNPWNLEHSPSGSSSGSAVAVAAGLCAAALGTDTGGSIRNPAAWCGVAGYKPTYGLVSRSGVFPLAFSVDHVGPLGRTVADCTLIMEALASHDPQDPSSSSIPMQPALSGAFPFAGLRIGVVANFLELPGTDRGVLTAITRAVQALTAHGAIRRDVVLPPPQSYRDIALPIVLSEAYAVHRSLLARWPECYGVGARKRILKGSEICAADYINAQRDRARMVRQMSEIMRDVDLLLMPTALVDACPFGDDFIGDQDVFLTRPFNLTGSPAISFRAGFSAAGLPLGLQLVGRPFEDRLVVLAASFLEKIFDDGPRWPGTNRTPPRMESIAPSPRRSTQQLPADFELADAIEASLSRIAVDVEPATVFRVTPAAMC